MAGGAFPEQQDLPDHRLSSGTPVQLPAHRDRSGDQRIAIIDSVDTTQVRAIACSAPSMVVPWQPR